MPLIILYFYILKIKPVKLKLYKSIKLKLKNNELY